MIVFSGFAMFFLIFLLILLGSKWYESNALDDAATSSAIEFIL